MSDTGGAVGEDALAVQLSDLARDLQHEDDPEALLVEIVQSAVALIPGTDEGSCTTGR